MQSKFSMGSSLMILWTCCTTVILFKPLRFLQSHLFRQAWNRVRCGVSLNRYTSSLPRCGFLIESLYVPLPLSNLPKVPTSICRYLSVYRSVHRSSVHWSVYWTVWSCVLILYWYDFYYLTTRTQRENALAEFYVSSLSQMYNPLQIVLLTCWCSLPTPPSSALMRYIVCKVTYTPNVISSTKYFLNRASLQQTIAWTEQFLNRICPQLMISSTDGFLNRIVPKQKISSKHVLSSAEQFLNRVFHRQSTSYTWYS